MQKLIKTFEDAMAELDSNHPFVREYRAFCAQSDDISSDMMAYLKLSGEKICNMIVSIYKKKT